MSRLASNVVVILLIVAGRTTLARDIYVDNLAGDDLNSGHAPRSIGGRTGPCRTIAKALRLAKPGDHIVLAKTAEPYRESITLGGARLSGYPDFPLTIEGRGAILDGSAPVPPRAWEHFRGDVFRFRPPRLRFAQLFLDGLPAERVMPEPNTQRLPPLKPLQWTFLDNYIYFRVEETKLPDQYALSYARHSVGITLYNVQNVVVSDLTVQGYQLDGINAHDGVFGADLMGVTARGCGRSGISVGGASRVQIISSLVGNNGAAQVRTEGHCELRIFNSNLLENTAPPIVRKGGRIWIDKKPYVEPASK